MKQPLVRAICALIFLLAVSCEETKADLAAQETPGVVSFTVTPDKIDRGGTVTLTWDVRGIERIAIQQYYGYKTGYDVQYDNLPPTGTLTVALGMSQPTPYGLPQPYIYGADFFLVLPGTSTSVWWTGEGVLAHTTVNIRCPYDGFFFGTDPYYTLCPLAPEQTITATYQPYERGFMIERTDTGTVYVFYINPGGDNGPAVLFRADQYADFPNIPLDAWDVPSGFYHPSSAIGRVWDSSHHMLVYSLGWAIGPEVSYLTTIQDTYGDAFFDPVAYLLLPDGRLIRYLESLYGGNWAVVTPTEPGQP